MRISRVIMILLVVCGLSLPVGKVGVIGLFAQEPAPPDVEVTARENVTLDFKDADIKSVLKVISYKSGINIVSTPEVMGAITIQLKDVPWEKALDTIVRTYGYAYEWIGDDVIMVATLEKLAEQRKAQEEAAAKEPLDTQAFTLNFAKADEVKTAVEELITPRGRITMETRTNTLVITDTKSNLIRISRVMKELDRITPQVMIEAKIIEANLDDTQNLGIKWTIGGTLQGAARPTTYPFTQHSGNKYLPDDMLSPTLKPDAQGSLFKLGTLDASGTTAVLEMLFNNDTSDMLSNPRIVTLDNQEAMIEVVTLDPTPQWTYNRERGTYVMTNYRQEKYGIILKVTPQINKLGYVTLKIEPEVSEWLRDKTLVGGEGVEVEVPVIYKQTTSTRVMVKDGNTLVIGGLIKTKNTEQIRKVPILGDIPILGFFFKHKAKRVEKKDLLIFITPRILTAPEAESA